MSHIFVVTNFNGNTGIPKWDMSRVTDMSHMFWAVRLFNGDISKWDVSNVADMNSLFSLLESFDSDISSWNVSSVPT